MLIVTLIIVAVLYLVVEALVFILNIATKALWPVFLFIIWTGIGIVLLIVILFLTILI